ncbi:TRAP transporter small permease subunit [Amaricoccus tamworthensis]|uniref:TRAP transporter small permease subunit n=1 Tax=Amaricoccus tamworthensis TaxID=57002 RepID=UPI003C7C035A
MHEVYRYIDAINEGIGRVVAWFTLLMVVVQFIVVVMRYVYSAPDFLGISSLWWQEFIVYLHGTLIMLGAGYTFLHNGHVRVDIFYSDASETVKNWTDLLGSLLFLLPVCYIIWWSAQPNVAMSWKNLEGSTEASGIPYKYVLKSTVMVAAVLLALQGISTALKCALRLRGEWVDDPYRGEESLD